MVRNLYGSFKLEISNNAQVLSEHLGFYLFFFLICCVYVPVVFWKANEAHSALLLLAVELHSSPRCVIIHESSNPQRGASTELALCTVITQQFLCSAGSSGQAGVWAKGTSICIQKPFKVYLNAPNALWYTDKLETHHSNILFPAVLTLRSSVWIWFSSCVQWTIEVN